MSTAANPQDDFEKSLLDMGVANELLMSDFDDDGEFTQNDDQVALSAHHNQTRQQPPPTSTQQDTLLTATLTTDNSTDQRTERTSPKRSNNNSNMTGLFGFLNAGNNNNNNDQIDQMDTSPHSSTIASTVATTSPKRVCRGQTTTTMTPPKSVASILEDAEKLIQSGGRTSSSPSAALTTTTPSPRKAASVEACGTCFSLQKLDLKDATPEAKLAAFKEFCTSDAFTSFCGTAGLHNPSFTWNHEYAVPNKPLYERFLGCLASDCTPQACLGIVFHGTATGNVPNILENGLDPKRRSGQAYGPGEYFGKTPGTSVSYCKGGRKMLVFVVLLPSIHTKRADHPTGDTTATSFNKQRTRYNVPMDYVVVENNHHQLPIGVLEFGSVDQAVLSKSQRMRNQLLKLNQEALAKSQQAEQLKLKATIIEYMVKEQWDNAEHKWQRHESALSGLAKREISMYAHMKLGDAELVNCLFPNMPDPMTSEELESSKEIVTVEKQEEDAKEAAEKLEEATQKMMKEQEKEQQKQKLQQQQQQTSPSHSHYQTSPNRAHHYPLPPPRLTALPQPLQPLKQPINQGTPHALQQVQPGLLTRGLHEHQQNPVWQSGTGSTQQQPFLAQQQQQQQQQPFGQHQQQSPAAFGQQQQRQGAPVVFGQQPPIVRQSQPYTPPGAEPRPLSQLLVECLTASPPTKKLTWQTDRDMPGRREMINYIVATAKAEPYQRISSDFRLPRMARAAEVMLYQNAANFDEYNNVLTMRQRLQDILQQQRRSAGITTTVGETPLGQQRWGSSSTGTPSHY